jgi:hypothetical protein
MEEQWYADRCRLRDLLQAHPTWTKRQCADEIGRSIGWVKKWRHRLREATPENDTVLWGRSRARHHPPPTISQPVIERILDIRDHPPANLKRIPGPRAILYYLHQDADLVASGARLPRSTRTVWQILTAHSRIAPRPRHHHEPLDRPPPLTVWQLDFKDVATVPADPAGKRQHVVEVLNTIDTGTSILLNAQVRADFTAETTLEAVVQTLQMHGLPDVLTFDRDPRFVGAASGRDFPAPFVRFLTCLGVEVDICPPQRPDKNAFVERYHRTYERECLKIHCPTTETEAETVTLAFAQHYNEERPNQAITCGNRPPRVAFPTLPVRPSLPAQVDPDYWLRTIDGRRFVRKVGYNGNIAIEESRYYISQKLAGQYVVLEVQAAAQAFVVHHRQQVLKQLPIKRLEGAPLAFGDYVALVKQQARSRQAIGMRMTRRQQEAAYQWGV